MNTKYIQIYTKYTQMYTNILKMYKYVQIYTKMYTCTQLRLHFSPKTQRQQWKLHRRICVYIYEYIYIYIYIYNKKPSHGTRTSNARTKPSTYVYIYKYTCRYIHGSKTTNKRTTPSREYNIDRQAQSHGGSHRHGGGPQEPVRRGRGGPHREHPSGAPFGSTNREGGPSLVPPSLCESLHVSVN